mgnify:CR=1 FL=1
MTDLIFSIFRYGIEFTDIDKYDVIREYLYINEDEIFERTNKDNIQMPISSLVIDFPLAFAP